MGGAVKACRHIGGDLPKKLATVDKSNSSYTTSGCKGDIQSPQFLRRENFYRYASLECQQAVVRCQGFHAYAGSVSEPQGFGRLIGSENFIVSSSPGVELGRWDKQNNNRAVKGYYV